MSLADLETTVVAAELMAPPDAGRRIAERIDATRREVVRIRSITRLLLALAAGLAVWGGWTLVDYLVELSWTIRAVGLVGSFAATIGVARRGLPRWTGAYRLDDAAADLERRLTQFGQRLRTTIDYQEWDADERERPARAEPILVRALEDDTYALSQSADFEEVVDSKPVLAAVGIVMACVVGWLLAIVASSEWRTATGRTLLLPWQYTQVVFAPAEITIKQGESATIGVEITGRPVRTATLRFRPAGSSAVWSELKLEADETTADTPADAARHQVSLLGKLSATLADCQEDLEFRVEAGPVQLPPGIVHVLQPLELDSFHARVTPPDYVGRPSEEFERWSFKVLEGSNIDLKIQLNRTAAEARLTPVRTKADREKSAPDASDDGAAVPGVVSLVISGPELHGLLSDLRTSGVWELTARSADGVDLEPQRLMIRVQPDGRAQVRFVEPAEELEVIATAEVPLVVEAADDHALLRVGIARQITGGKMETVWQREFGAGADGTVRGETTLQLEDQQLTYQDGVTYYAFAEDNYFGEPRRTSTPLRFIDIRPFKMAYQMLDAGGT